MALLRSTRSNWIGRLGRVAGSEPEDSAVQPVSGGRYPGNPAKDDAGHRVTAQLHWTEWRGDGRAGAVSRITPARRKAAAALVHDGRAVMQ